MLHTVLLQLAIITAAFATALLLLARSVKAYAKGRPSDYVNGSWIRYPVLDKPIATPRQRLMASIFGFLALGKQEALYHFAATDSEGQPLLAENDYLIEGIPPQAAYWSIAVYGPDKRLVANDSERHSCNNKTIRLNDDGSYTISVSKEGASPNRLFAGKQGRFYLYMRTYLPENAGETVLPTIVKRSDS